MKKIPSSTVRRLSFYLRHLQGPSSAALTVSSRNLADAAGTTPAQVRKDLSVFGSFGTRGIGYDVPALTENLREILGLDRPWRVALIGAGRVGSALFGYRTFHQRGFHIRAVFDVDPAKVDTDWNGVRIRHPRDLPEVIRDERIEMAIVAVPAKAAPGVVDQLAASGVRAILNFAPVTLQVPPEVALRTVDMTVELEALSFALGRGSVASDSGDPLSSSE